MQVSGGQIQETKSWTMTGQYQQRPAAAASDRAGRQPPRQPLPSRQNQSLGDHLIHGRETIIRHWVERIAADKNIGRIVGRLFSPVPFWLSSVIRSRAGDSPAGARESYLAPARIPVLLVDAFFKCFLYITPRVAGSAYRWRAYLCPRGGERSFSTSVHDTEKRRMLSPRWWVISAGRNAQPRPIILSAARAA